eukprot:scaffold6298_cov152-Amphora_coffeaeformis.AAC.2
MGLLKHVVLPAFGLMHAASVAACSDLSSWASMVGLKDDSVSDDDKNSVRQNHMLGALRGFNVAMMLLCGMGAAKESAHFRAQIVLAEAAFFAVVTVDAFRLGGLNYLVPGFQTLLATVAYAINAMEP